MDVTYLSAVKPLKYTLNIDLSSVHEKTYRGKVLMTLQLDKQFTKIFLHSKRLHISWAKIDGIDMNIEYLAEDVIAIECGDDVNVFGLQSKNISLEIEFRGIINNLFFGLHFLPSTESRVVQDIDAWATGETIIGTQFEPAHCREVFPCLDLPYMKAVFQLNVIGVPSDMICLSNTPLIDNSDSGTLYSFEPTPLMSTYLLGFWVGKFASFDAVNLSFPGDSRHSVSIKAYVPSYQNVQHASFVFNLGQRAFEKFAELFENCPYPLLKLDFICVPGMAGIGMENFGAITMKQDYMLVNVNSKYSRIRRIARLVCHEVSHQWYGNVVTPFSFDELWLKEGLARYFEFVVLDTLEPSYNIWMDFFEEVMFAAMIEDGSPSSHPVLQEHHGNLSSIIKSFDIITYGKGASVLRMLAYYIGFDVFIQGIRNLLNRHRFGCVRQDDLWQALQDSVDDAVSKGHEKLEINIKKLMEGWLIQSSFPAITVTLKGSVLYISQRCLYESNQSADFTPPLWHIPLHIQAFNVTENKKYAHFLVMNSKEMEVVLDKEAINDSNTEEICWGLIVNSGYAGFFISQYADENSWETVLRTYEKGTEAEKLGVINDIVLSMKEALYFNENAQAECKIISVHLQRLTEIEKILRSNIHNCEHAWLKARIELWIIETKAALAKCENCTKSISKIRAEIMFEIDVCTVDMQGGRLRAEEKFARLQLMLTSMSMLKID